MLTWETQNFVDLGKKLSAIASSLNEPGRKVLLQKLTDALDADEAINERMSHVKHVFSQMLKSFVTGKNGPDSDYFKKFFSFENHRPLSREELQTFRNFFYVSNIQKLANEIKKSQSVDVAQESDEDDVFGKWAWPSQRDAMINAGVEEEDTSIEKKAHAELEKYVLDNVKPSKETVDTLRELLKAGKYSQVIKAPPAGTTIYRGLLVSDDDLRGFLKSDGDIGVGIYQVNGVHKNRSTVSGWTTVRQIAVSEFAKKQFDPIAEKKNETVWKLIVVASVDKSVGKLLACDDALYDVHSLDKMHPEHEVIAIDDIEYDSLEVLGSYEI